ncbi:hypothetical protein GCM10018783_53660 [Streptomyces griseosporeus]|nr:hypothetical protein GCM10018783_53660 [Streptomyces griseosporeus]
MGTPEAAVVVPEAVVETPGAAVAASAGAAIATRAVADTATRDARCHQVRRLVMWVGGPLRPGVLLSGA